jgi:CheY-like chemotaxis protein
VPTAGELAIGTAVERAIGSLLLVEDDDGDAFLVTELLSLGSPQIDVRRVTSLAEAEHQLRTRPLPDVVVLDLGLPDAEGVQIVPRIVTAAPAAAVLVLTGLSDEGRGTAAVANGAQDYLIKGQVNERDWPGRFGTPSAASGSRTPPGGRSSGTCNGCRTSGWSAACCPGRG